LKEIVVMPRPLVVDLDGTLIQTDLLWEGLLLLLHKAPLKFLWAIFMELPRGKSRFKMYLADNIMPDVSVLPYNLNVINILHKARIAGRELVLASASPRIWVDAVAKHLSFFETVLASDQHVNLSKENKLKKVQECCGEKGFDYIGDSAADIPIWHSSKIAMVVGRRPNVIRQIKKPEDCITFIPKEYMRNAWLKSLRPQQWSKNILLFIPIILAHNFTDFLRWGLLLAAIIAFSLMSSSVYLFNDLLDIESDRHHAQKRLRPIPSGRLSIFAGFTEGIISFSVALFISYYMISLNFMFLLVGYFLFSIFYSLWLKRILLIDVLVLTLLYNLRITAGGLIADVTVSPWLYTLLIFFFLNLAFLKRYNELYKQAQINGTNIKGRGYITSDLPVVFNGGLMSGFISVLVFYIYLGNSEQARILYHRPAVLSFIGVILLYWNCRLWFFAHRHETLGIEDPIEFVLQDTVSWICALVGGLLFIVSIL